MNQYTHDQYFLSVINDQRACRLFKSRLAAGQTIDGQLQAYCWDHRKHCELRPLNTVEFADFLIATKGYILQQLDEETPRCKELRAENQKILDAMHTTVTGVQLLTDSIPVPTKEPAMSRAPAFETKHFVDGQDATTITDEGLIHAIRRLETEIEALGEIKTKSNKITSKIEELNKQREAIAALLDSRP